MEFRQLKYFVQVAESLNFTEASKKLFVTQSTISQQINQLEEDLNTLLFDRSEKKIALTEAGQLFLPNAKQILKDAEDGKQRLLDLQKIRTGTLTIGVNYSFSNLLTYAVPEFLKAYPNIKLNVYYKTVSELLEMVKKRDVDLALSYKPVSKEKNLETEDLYSTRLSVIVNKKHPLSKLDSISLADIQQYPLALPAKGLHARLILDAALYRKKITLDPQIEIDEATMLLLLVKTGNWISILSPATIIGETDFKAIPLIGDDYEMQAALLWIKGSYQKFSAREFIKILVKGKENIF